VLPENADDRQAPPLRLADADREELARALGRHYADGRLDADALDERLDVVLRAEQRAEAATALADLPPLASPVARRRRRRGRHGEATTPEAGWIPTTERFVDPSTGRVIRVWVVPGDGERRYVPEADRSNP